MRKRRPIVLGRLKVGQPEKVSVRFCGTRHDSPSVGLRRRPPESVAKDSHRMAERETGEQDAEWWGDRDFLRFIEVSAGRRGTGGEHAA
jgi:hypothetical protein